MVVPPLLPFSESVEEDILAEASLLPCEGADFRRSFLSSTWQLSLFLDLGFNTLATSEERRSFSAFDFFFEETFLNIVAKSYFTMMHIYLHVQMGL